MNRKIAIIASIINMISIIGFAFCMPFKLGNGSYFFSMFIAFSFAIMMAAFGTECKEENRVAANVAMIFAGIYTTIILLVYFAQLTSVRLDNLNTQASQLLNYKEFGLLFNYDLLGYAVMALSTFFMGLTVNQSIKRDKWLKYLLMGHGVFFFSCLIVPMIGLFSTSTHGSGLTGVIVMEFWCLYFLPISLLSFFHFRANPFDKGTD